MLTSGKIRMGQRVVTKRRLIRADLERCLHEASISQLVDTRREGAVGLVFKMVPHGHLWMVVHEGEIVGGRVVKAVYVEDELEPCPAVEFPAPKGGPTPKLGDRVRVLELDPQPGMPEVPIVDTRQVGPGLVVDTRQEGEQLWFVVLHEGDRDAMSAPVVGIYHRKEMVALAPATYSPKG